MSRTRDSTKCRRICFDTHKKQDERGIYMICHVGKCRIEPAKDGWRADHIRRWAEGGEDTPENLWPICRKCDEVKAPEDTSEVAKGKRVAESVYGVKVSDTPMPFGKRSRFKKRMDGKVIDRETGEPWRGK